MPESTTYGKTQLVEDVARRTELTQRQAAQAIEAALGLIGEQIAAGNRVTLPGFGSWSLTERSARQGVNPQTRQPITIPAQTAVRFHVGSTLKKAVGGPTNPDLVGAGDGGSYAKERGASVTPS